MPIRNSDFDLPDGIAPPPQSQGYDPARPHLFEGLTPMFPTSVVRSCFVPMRDGVRLSTDFHIPRGAQLPLPVVLVRTPYNKHSIHNALPYVFPEQGIIYAVQDVRGRCESEGEFIACSAVDRNDGYDTIDWLAKQTWCSGAIGMMGSSYTGETTAKAAAMRHPNHLASVIMCDGSYAGGACRNGAYLQGGVTMLRMMFGWFRDFVPKVSYGPPPHIDRETWFGAPFSRAYTTQPVSQPPVDTALHLRTLPVFDLLDRTGAAPSEFADMMRRSAEPADPYWRQQGFLTEEDHFDTPTIHLTGPLERGGSSPDNFRLFRKNGVSRRTRDNQIFIFSPAPHSQYHQCSTHSVTGARDFGDTRFPYYRMFVQWFGHWLREDANDVEQWPRVQYFAANRNNWRTADEWPPKDAQELRWFLTSDSHANTRVGDGRLALAPSTIDAFDHYLYNPDDPTPSEPAAASLDLLGAAYTDRSELEMREDILIYTSPPLDEPIEIVGPVSVILHVSSSAKDTDFGATLVEVDARHRAINVTSGIARMRYREGLDKKVWMKVGQVYQVTIDLWHAAMVIPVGHRIRLELASSQFPAFDRNLNTGGDNYTDTHWVKAENAVHHGPSRPSALILQVRAVGLL